MAHIDSKTMHRLARDPAAMARFQATGRLPRPSPPPSSPLIELLESIEPRMRAAIRGVKVGPELGYMGSRTFQTAAQALAWLRPPHAGLSHPAESWRDKRFSRRLSLADLAPHCSQIPESLSARIQRQADQAGAGAQQAKPDAQEALGEPAPAWIPATPGAAP